MNNTALRRLLALSLAAALTLSLPGCAGKSSAPVSDGSLQSILDSGRLVLGLDASFPPMGFTDGSGEIVGFDIDVAQEVCDRLGIELVKKSINWDEKEDELNSGAIDCIWNGMSITPGRAEAMCLSEPYMKNELIFVVDGSSDIKGNHDLGGKEVGVQSGSTALEVLEASELSEGITVVTDDDNMALFQKLRQGVIDAALIDSAVAYYVISTSTDRYYVLSDSLSEDKFAIGFRKGDQELRDRIQELINEMKADGTLGKISKKWFGSDITIVK